MQRRTSTDLTATRERVVRYGAARDVWPGGTESRSPSWQCLLCGARDAGDLTRMEDADFEAREHVAMTADHRGVVVVDRR